MPKAERAHAKRLSIGPTLNRSIWRMEAELFLLNGVITPILRTMEDEGLILLLKQYGKGGEKFNLNLTGGHRDEHPEN